MSSDKFEEGLKIRREVLGDEYVEKALAGADEFHSANAGARHRILLGHRLVAGTACRRKTRSLINLVND